MGCGNVKVKWERENEVRIGGDEVSVGCIMYTRKLVNGVRPNLWNSPSLPLMEIIAK